MKEENKELIDAFVKIMFFMEQEGYPLSPEMREIWFNLRKISNHCLLIANVLVNSMNEECAAELAEKLAQEQESDIVSYHISIIKQGDKYSAGIDAEGAYQAFADTPLQALRKWIHYVGAGVVKYRNEEITLERLAERMGVDIALAAEIAEVETLVPPPELVGRARYLVSDKN